MRCLAAICCAAIATGCSKQSDPNRFYPPAERARYALETALSAWQNGADPGPVPGTMNPIIQLVDSHFPAGRRPTSFAVLGLAPGEGPRVFTVTLTLDRSTTEIRTRYVVIGVDPIWVIRQEDYDMMAQWEHKHEAKSKTSDEARPSK